MKNLRLKSARAAKDLSQADLAAVGIAFYDFLKRD